MHRHALTDEQWARLQPLLPWRRSRGGFSTKLHVVVDAKARPLYVTLTPGERHEMTKAFELLDYVSGRAVIGDTGYDSNEFRTEIRYRGIKAVIHSKPERKRAQALPRYRDTVLEDGDELPRARADRMHRAVAQLGTALARASLG